MGEIYMGTSGWSYNEWTGVFYPSSDTSKLSYYSKVFKTVEVDSTFYAYPGKGLVHGWARYTPDEFVFSAKLPKVVTHDKAMDPEKGVETDLIRFLDLMKPLIEKGKLGPILVQLPPSFTEERDAEKLRRFLEIVPEDIMFAVEFRHPSWLKTRTWEMLARHNVANTIVDEPLLPPDDIVTADFAFIRWHGRGSKPWYNYRYSENELTPWVPKVKEVAKKVKRVFGYFNNHFHGFAVENSLKMLQMLGEASPQQLEVRERATRYIDSKGESRGREKAQGSILEYMSSGG